MPIPITETMPIQALFAFQQGVVSNIEDGFIWIESASEEMIPCYIIRNATETNHIYQKSDVVLWVRNAHDSFGYILGKIEKYHPENDLAPKTETAQHQDETILLQTDKRQNIVLNGKKIQIKASEKLILDCGDSSLEMDHRGKVVLKGVDVNSRARRNNKIKGGNIALN